MDLNHMHIISCLQVRNTPAGTNRSLQEVLHFPTSSGNLVASLWPENDQQIDIAVYILPGKRLVCGIDNLLIAHILTYATQKSAAHNLKFFEPTGPGKNHAGTRAFHLRQIIHQLWKQQWLNLTFRGYRAPCLSSIWMVLELCLFVKRHTLCTVSVT